MLDTSTGRFAAANDPHRTQLVRFVSAAILLVVAGFAVTGYLVKQSLDQTAANTRRIEVNTYQACDARNANIDRLNALYAGLIEIERSNPVAAAETVRMRIDLYTAAHLTRLHCGVKP